MTADKTLEIFLVTVPGLEAALQKEALEKGFAPATVSTGGVTVTGGWQDVWRANLELRGPSHVLVRLGSFRVQHLAKLDKRSRSFPWDDTLRSDKPVRVEVTCKKSRIYHDKAAAERLEKAIRTVAGAEISKDATVCVKARIFDDLCTISVDTSGEALHKRGHKEAVNKAPMRENLAALLLRECGFDGSEPVIDPMCGSGTFVIEAAEIANGLNPGRSRSFAFEALKTFDADAWQELKQQTSPHEVGSRFYGFDRDAGAIRMSQANADRAGVAAITEFSTQPISELSPPEGAAGLVIINPPYGARIGDVARLRALYSSLGKTLRARFAGWRVGLVTNTPELAKATGLPFGRKPVAFSHGGIPVKLFKTPPLRTD
ncbi:THUMP domain-containing class I SAM-dependent RNA methyltransferase [Kordiimonas aestuarii]|uniref:THUMP domain-containing class I SAM-dependent RNA methyltransferase n=1 Tax=Kordiimonas aestuarii TaxID=1005925 RepID=UPI0021D3AAF2|nr:class I SAM-dependent RNA methyltransferase [Kordiimonas aestuarii]